MFADDKEMGTPGDETEGAAETMNMADSADEKPAKAKKEKKAGDWITVETPKISKADVAAAKQEAAPAPKATPASKPAPSPMEATMMDAPSSGATAAPASTGAASPSAPMVVQPASGGGSSVPLGGMLANMGVKDEKTQKIIVYAGGGLIALCCLCSCVGVALNFLPGLLGN
jgi:hypothetical protein